MRKRIVAGNWKMNKTYEEALSLVSEIDNMVKDEVNEDVTVIVTPPFPFLQGVGKLVQGNDKMHLAAQDVSEHDSGAYTGEVSAAMLKSVGVEYVIIGHSERRLYHHEDAQLLYQKMKAAIKNGLKPIFCCGEPLEERDADRHFDYVGQQLKDSVSYLSNEEFDQIVIAYEPIWAIGTGKTATAEQAQEMHAYIREQLSRMFDAEAAYNCSILYGGSCNPGNAQEIFSKKDVDGGLVGGASLKSRDFTDIIKSF
ncbi:triosephosphate isomerase [Pontibacter ummariensis]|uniref:Triosephosphate isomerase n=1 Tax=Pontibacter ummariensis TaxID=1610492 RepID=A0A239JKR7_9BACT|nr:triose-phosphate isomerase [Pontibacter ummariensis]PRY07868.1 triosephosphate isomerase [Pontibacter ummariensis]SNT06447.1 triosephosphate isomerase [Pontibacter ummariensis]